MDAEYQASGCQDIIRTSDVHDKRSIHGTVLETGLVIITLLNYLV